MTIPGRRLLAALLVAAILPACQGRGDTDAEADAGRFGYGFTPGSQVVLQDDVVAVRGGSSSIRAASADGLTWYLDPDAPGASDLAVGRVMIATSRAVGRVADVRESAAGLRVVLVPITIGELFKDADLRLDAPLDLAAMKVQEMSAPVGAEEVHPLDVAAGRVAPAQTADGFTRVVGPTLRLAAPQAEQPADPTAPPSDDPINDEQGDTMRPAKKGAKFKGSVGSWEVEGSFDQSGLGFKVQYKVGGADSSDKEKDHDASIGLKFGFEVKMKSAGTPRVSGEMRVADGKATPPSLQVDGFDALDVNVYAGAPHGKHDDVKVRLEIPFEMYADMPPISGGVPTAVSIKFKVTADVFLGGNNATLTGNASYDLTHSPFTFLKGQPSAVDFAAKTAMINTLDGLSLAPSGVTFGVETRFLWGLGFSYAHIGPFVKVATSWGLGIGSALFPYYNCKLSRLRVDVGGGVGIAFNNKSYLTKVLAKSGPPPEAGLLDKLKIDIEFGATKTVVDKKAWGPADKQVCAF